MTRAPARAHSRAAVLAPKALIALADSQTTAHGCADAAARAVVDARAHGAVVTAPVRFAQANGHAVVDGRAGQIRRLGYCSAIPAEPAAAAVVQRDAAIIEGHERRCQRRPGGGSSEHHQKNRERKSSPHCFACFASSGRSGGANRASRSGCKKKKVDYNPRTNPLRRQEKGTDGHSAGAWA